MPAFFKNTYYRGRRILRKWVTAVGKRIPAVLRFARATVWAARRRSYARMCATVTVDPSVVLFDAYSGRRYACSPRALYQCLLDPARSAAAPIKPVWVLRKGAAHALRERGYDVRGLDEGWVPSNPTDIDSIFSSASLEDLKSAVIVPYGSPEYYRSFARAGLWVSNARLPQHVNTREGQTFVQSWHGTPLKRIGCDMDPSSSGNAIYQTEELHESYRAEGRRCTYMLSPSRFATEKFASAFDLSPERAASAIIEEGYPRNDFLQNFTDADVVRIRTELGIPEGKKVILYAPTWRDNQHSSGVGYTYKAEADFDALREALGDEYVILFRAHYFIANSFDFTGTGGFVIDVSKVDDINDLYVVSDVLVTDYSSVLFDYANLRRPMVFFMYDLDEYAGDLRGFYFDLEQLPGPIVRTNEELIEALRAAGAPGAKIDPRYDAFHERFNYLDDGHASERVVRRLVELGALPSAATGSER